MSGLRTSTEALSVQVTSFLSASAPVAVARLVTSEVGLAVLVRVLVSPTSRSNGPPMAPSTSSVTITPKSLQSPVFSTLKL